MSMPDTIFIFLLVLVLFGPKKLPEIAREVGKFLAEFKRASNNFKSQIQSEMDKAGVDVGPLMQAGGQQTSSFAQTLLPPSVKSALSEIDSAHERLMNTARMAFDAQNFTVRPPEAPVVVSTAAEELSVPVPAEACKPAVQASAAAASHEASPAEAVTEQPTLDPAPAQSDSALQSS
jgi:sec-independent protein translocase protein TatB